jgi:hypothetical protein
MYEPMSLFVGKHTSFSGRMLHRTAQGLFMQTSSHAESRQLSLDLISDATRGTPQSTQDSDHLTMCVKAKTTYDCGHSFKSLDHCDHAIFNGEDSCSEADRKHYSREGDCESCSYIRHCEAQRRRIERTSQDVRETRDVEVEIFGDLRYAGVCWTTRSSC